VFRKAVLDTAFDYGALADKLFGFASRGNVPSRNRQRLYKIIKILRDLSEGVFPQDGYPEEVSTDEDDDMFGSRSKIKWKLRMDEEEEAPAAKKKKKNGKKPEKLTGEKKQESVGDNGEPAKTKKKKKKKKRNKVGKEGEEAKAEVASTPAQMEAKPTATEEQSEQSPPTGADAAGRSESLATVDGGSEPLKTIAAAEPTGQAGEQAAAAATQEEDVGPAEPASTPSVKPAAAAKQKGRKKSKSLVVEAGANEAEATPTPPEEAAAADSPTDTDATVPAKKTRRRSRKSLASACVVEEAPAPTESPSLDAAAETTPTLGAAAETTPTLVATTTETHAPAKKRQKGSQAAVEVEGRAAVEVEDLGDAVSVATPKKNKIKKTADKREVETLAEDSVVVCKAPQSKKNKKTPKAEEAAAPTKAEPEPDQTLSADASASKKKQKKAVVVAEKEGVASRETPAVPLAQKKKKKRKIPVVFEFEADEVEAAAAASLNGLAGEDDTLPATPKKSKLQNGAAEMPATPLGSTKAPRKKLLKSPGMKAKSPGKPFISFQTATAPPHAALRQDQESPSPGVLNESRGGASPMGLQKRRRNSRKTPIGSPKRRPSCGRLF
ncbi:hypothetical protein CRUP_007949, partial [Coryphaenoides rupestris]